MLTDTSGPRRLRILDAAKKLADLMDWEGWVDQIPPIPMEDGWHMKPVPPFNAAVVRFHIRKDTYCVSVYLDCFGILGGMDVPYWEMYPDTDDRPQRFPMQETAALSAAIAESLEHQRKTDADK